MSLFKEIPKDLLTIREASIWASKYLKQNVVESNISYLVQYGRIRKISDNGSLYISKNDLKIYYDSYNGKRELKWKSKFGDDLNWGLSFDHLREKDTTKHVHRLHPYKGKFIPQLVEYFLDDHKDNFKKKSFFRKGDIILDPFCGSGTAMVQANELGIHCIGIDISVFNTLISNSKVAKYDLIDLNTEIKRITRVLNDYSNKSKIPLFEQELLEELYDFNNKYFPSPEFRYKVRQKEIKEFDYGLDKANEFIHIYNILISKYRIKLKLEDSISFLDEWYLPCVRKEIALVLELVNNVKNFSTQSILRIILSRTIRSCRATTHSDLATLKEPQRTSYYCVKHKKICKPLFSIRNKWRTYSKDTLRRLSEFNHIRSDTFQVCLEGDSRTIDIFKSLKTYNNDFYKIAKSKKINGVFSSPPYVGLIDYHEQHAYAYELFNLERKDELEIGPLYKGQGVEARKSYINGVVRILKNCRKYLVTDFNIFIVANDKYNLYPIIAEKSGMRIINQYKRPVLNRTERDKGAYSESIFHFKSKRG